MRRIINFGRARYAFVILKAKGQALIAYQRVGKTSIDWKKLTILASSATIEAQ